MPPMDRKPPLAVSPRRLRPRRVLRPVPAEHTPPVAASKKTKLPTRSSFSEDMLIRPENQLISPQLKSLAKMPPVGASNRTQLATRSSFSEDLLVRAECQFISPQPMSLAKRVKEDFGPEDDLGASLNSSISCAASPLFERGRFYELYSARRNERLKRKMVETGEEENVAQDPCVAVELAKRRASKKVESVRKSVPANFSVNCRNALRSSVRSSMDTKKVAVAAVCYDRSPADAGKRIGTRSVRKL